MECDMSVALPGTLTIRQRPTHRARCALQSHTAGDPTLPKVRDELPRGLTAVCGQTLDDDDDESRPLPAHAGSYHVRLTRTYEGRLRHRGEAKAGFLFQFIVWVG
jgi:hypothetical protein